MGAMLEFLDTAARKGWFTSASASAMRSVSSRLREVLEPTEEHDVRNIDAQSVVSRFGNISTEVSPASLRTYRSRFEAARASFVENRENPLEWRPKTKSRSGSSSDGTVRRRVTLNDRKNDATRDTVVTDGGALTYPFPLRENITISITGLPRDLKVAEAERIAAFLKSLSQDFAP